MSIELAKDVKKEAIASIERYFAENMEVKVGNIAAGALLNYFLAELGPVVYNQAIADVQARLQIRVSELDIEHHEDEFQYWRQYDRLKKRWITETLLGGFGTLRDNQAMPSTKKRPSNSSYELRDDLTLAFDTLLQPERFKDYGPNGLQVEGKLRIRHLVSGVTASRALIEAAIEVQADAIFVHHGLFWRGQDSCVTGWMKQRLALLLAHDINLYAYHLPLDAHPSLGNNAQLGQVLGLTAFDGSAGRFGEQDLGFLGARTDGRDFAKAQSLANHVEKVLQHPVTLVPPGPGELARPIKKIAWCTGGAQSYFEAAIAAGADAFITGEISEPQAHYARESGVAYLACGHHASERFGAPAVATHVAAQCGLTHRFIDIDNPAWQTENDYEISIYYSM
jgi:dinuclear metal center YbgI/SA1388 family protein